MNPNLTYKCPHGHPVQRAAAFGAYYCPTCDVTYSAYAVTVYQAPPPPKPHGEQLAFAEFENGDMEK